MPVLLDACFLYSRLLTFFARNGEKDTNHGRMAHVVLPAIRAQVKRQYNKDAEIYVACGSRPTDENTWKNSYHVTVANLVFIPDRTYENQMLRLANSLAEIGNSEDWECERKDKTGCKTGCILDLSVYTKNRVFRLPGNCKLGDSVPIARISGDPSNDDLTASFEQNK